MKKGNQHIEYSFQVHEGPPLTELDYETIANLIAAWIYRDLRNKRKIATMSKEETQ